jgi:hypothetical protein
MPFVPFCLHRLSVARLVRLKQMMTEITIYFKLLGCSLYNYSLKVGVLATKKATVLRAFLHNCYYGEYSFKNKVVRNEDFTEVFL